MNFEIDFVKSEDEIFESVKLLALTIIKIDKAQQDFYLSRKDLINILENIIKRQGGKCKPSIIGDFKIETILSASILKALGPISVNKNFVENLINKQHLATIKDSNNSVNLQVECHFYKYEDDFKKIIITKNGKCEKDFLLIKQVAGQPNKGSAINIAFSKLDSQIYAIKEVILAPTTSWESIFRGEIRQIREVQIMSKLFHKNIIRLFDWWVEEKQKQREGGRVQKFFILYQQLEYVTFSGCHNLLIYSAGYLMNMPQNQKKRIMKKLIEQILDGLEYIYRQGFFHRDIKLENILITQDFYGDIVVRICDFDHGKQHSNGFALQSQLTGTELLNGNKSRKGACYDCSEELIQFAHLFLDLCHTYIDQNERKKYHLDAAKQIFPQNLEQDYTLELNIIKDIFYQQQIEEKIDQTTKQKPSNKTWNDLRESENFIIYINSEQQ